MKNIPVLKLGPVLFLTVPENMNDAMAQSLEEDVLHQLHKTGAIGVVIDITSLEIIDSFMARILSETVETTKIMGARIVIVGMSVVATITLLELGLEMNDVETAMDLETGMQKLGFRIQERVSQTVDVTKAEV